MTSNVSVRIAGDLVGQSASVATGRVVSRYFMSHTCSGASPSIPQRPYSCPHPTLPPFCYRVPEAPAAASQRGDGPDHAYQSLGAFPASKLVAATNDLAVHARRRWPLVSPSRGQPPSCPANVTRFSRPSTAAARNRLSTSRQRSLYPTMPSCRARTRLRCSRRQWSIRGPSSSPISEASSLDAVASYTNAHMLEHDRRTSTTRSQEA